MPNLIDLLKEQLSDELLGQFGAFLNLDKNKTSSALGAFLPAILSSITSKGSSQSGAASLLGLIKDNNLGESFLSNFAGSLGSDEGRNGLLKVGGLLTSSLLGSKQSSMIDKLSSLTGIGKSESGSLMSMLAPFALSHVGKMVKNQGLDASGLQKLLGSQKKNIMGALPMGFADFFEDKAEAVTESAQKVSSGGGFPKWVIPVLIALGLLFLLARSCNKKDIGADDINVDKTTVKKMEKDAEKNVKNLKNKIADVPKAEPTDFRMDDKGNVVNAAGTILHRAEDLTLDKLGNLVDKAGRVIVPKQLLEAWKANEVNSNLPKLMLDDNGNLIDANGKVLYKKGEFTEVNGYYVDKDGKRIGFLGKVGQAIGNAADATADAFKDVFNGIFGKKDRQGSVYKLSKVEFNPEDHRLTYYSKPEFQALVNSLKKYPEAKIEFQVFTNDGGNESENKKLSKQRANVIHDMAVSMGIDDKQAKYTGKGSSDAALAATNEVLVVVEQ